MRRHSRSRPTDPGVGWVFSQLHLPRPLEVNQVDTMLLRMAADRAAPPLVFEARSEHNQLTQHLVGTPAEHVVWVQRTLRHLLPELDIEGIDQPRLAVDRSARVRLRPRAFALAVERAEVTSLSLLSALSARLDVEERLVVQIVLGPRMTPKHLPKEIADPTQPWWQMLTIGQRPAGKPVRDQIDARSGQHGFAAVIRLGVAAKERQRRQQLVVGVLGALSTAIDRGTYMDLVFEPAVRFNAPQLPRHWNLHLGATELTGLLGWPLGSYDPPGVAPLHPRPLRVPEKANKAERLFAVPGGPGPGAPIGIAARDIPLHLLAMGPTGVGKSTVLLNLIAADIAAGRPVLVIDPKYQLIRDIVERAVPRARIDDVVIIDPAEAMTGKVVGFNPLNVGDRDPDVVVDGLVAVLREVFHDGWGPRTEDIIHSALLTLARVGANRKSPFTLIDLPRLLADERFRRGIIGEVLDDPGLASFWSGYLAMSPGAQVQAIAAPMNKLRQYLLRPSLRAILGQAEPPFRLRDIFKDNKVVLVPLNEALIGPITAQLLGSLIVAETWSATMERASEVDPSSRPATVVIDEVQQYLHLPVSIDDALSRSRSNGVGWHLAHQHRAQLSASTRAAIDTNAKSKVIFQLLDPDDAYALAKQAPSLQAVDFLNLGQYQAYANLTAGGAPAGWALIRTLPPPEPTGLGEEVRNRSHDRYASPIPQSPQAVPVQPHSQGAGGDELGRKRRRT
ncbi:type IV secretory system conjugative DNA transfer family protein [Ferrimicrobium acidiphilum]|uniref:type IV secretory system conjugative DNA transfer family protein n=1 Tax=Ferrimicrobium acidiphilum TaxID=121039 RepID=UPI0023EF9571|nr:hypothetical protein [Ferrimicrobium acidiphilum]